MSEMDKAGYLGFAFGVLITALSFVTYMNVWNLEPMPVCHEIGPAIHGEVEPAP